ncbi:MAG: sulfite exporter TauE/SafE family protein, partial [Pseudomonadota bacterium]|nr:sulfite exporter TauE/SafE family protein [Pseudomonadota bacterium]
IYTVFVASRVHDKAGLRATMGTLVLINSFIRAGLFTIAGLYAQPGLLLTGVLLVPVVLAGLWLGNRLHARLPSERVLHVLWAVLAVGAVNLIWRNAFA